MLDVPQELLTYAATLILVSEGSNNPDQAEGGDARANAVALSKEELIRLVSVENNHKNKRMAFFNNTDGLVLRLVVQGHEPQLGKSLYYSLCGQNHEEKRCHRSSYNCTICVVNLCLRVHRGLRKMCWSMWHLQKELSLRMILENPNPSRRSMENSRTGSSIRACRRVMSNMDGRRASSGQGEERGDSAAVMEDRVQAANEIRARNQATLIFATNLSTTPPEDENTMT
ncbi:hypothetical protein BWQ96_00946 [Gracilariopsis chorda]|uniref:Uncharacterized protein n=1 Tax=Gracilariopsis chorda TaxID=448386 RepID=A0A2V3J5H7_9FLOR|nr:hypothetical protein BWQ96_00946 [Gracilariopsis chorda]|eukprot:PXF49372.1 hypothetical protein BWQ96_00946 [Gracilariopsis chorda]